MKKPVRPFSVTREKNYYVHQKDGSLKWEFFSFGVDLPTIRAARMALASCNKIYPHMKHRIVLVESITTCTVVK